MSHDHSDLKIPIFILTHFDFFFQNVSNNQVPCGNNIYDMLLMFINTGNTTSRSNFTECNDNFMTPKALKGQAFYVYTTPFIFVLGVIGNLLSLTVFMSSNMRRLSASSYLAALSVSDLLVLIFYVLVEWLKRGLVHISPSTKIDFMDKNGICQMLLFLSYALRFLSTWLVTAFTVERYIGVCHPLHRRYICSLHGSRLIVCGLVVTSCILAAYKPFLSGVRINFDGTNYCTAYKEYQFVSFVLDSAFALLITAVPFLIISVLNLLIIRKLFLRRRQFKHIPGQVKLRRDKRSQMSILMRSENSGIRLEFTVTLFAVSFFFVAFNAPYFIVWFRNFLNSKYLSKELIDNDIEYWRDVLDNFRTIFYMNYSINFFLYSISGRSFRNQLRQLLKCNSELNIFYSRRNSTSNSKSWV